MKSKTQCEMPRQAWTHKQPPSAWPHSHMDCVPMGLPISHQSLEKNHKETGRREKNDEQGSTHLLSSTEQALNLCQQLVHTCCRCHRRRAGRWPIHPLPLPQRLRRPTTHGRAPQRGPPPALGADGRVRAGGFWPDRASSPCGAAAVEVRSD